MARAKATTLKLDFPELAAWQEKLNAIDGRQTRRAIEDALKESQRIIADKAEAAMIPHNKTGETRSKIIRDGEVKWTQDVAEIPVGFHIDGIPMSIFLMRGTKVLGQPHITPDRNLYNAVYGTATKREVREAQAEAFAAVIREVIG